MLPEYLPDELNNILPGFLPDKLPGLLADELPGCFPDVSGPNPSKISGLYQGNIIKK
jgi:hypothetical protein